MTCTCTQKGPVFQYKAQTGALTVGAISGPHCHIGALLSLVMDLHGWKKALWKSRQLTSASGGSEHAQLFSLVISWGNKMNFSLYANIADFCSDGCNQYLVNYVQPQKINKLDHIQLSMLDTNVPHSLPIIYSSKYSNNITTAAVLLTEVMSLTVP